jgi:hypothetical protein
MNAILIIDAPKTRKQDPTTTVYCYSQLLSRHAVLQKWGSSQIPLTSLTWSKVEFEWHSSPLQAFDKIIDKKTIGAEMWCISLISRLQSARSVSSLYWYTMHQIISWGQSSCRIQLKQRIFFYSQKINTAQMQYTTTEADRELLSAIETFKEHKNVLLGYHVSISVFTDHTYNNFDGLKSSDRILR